MSRSNSLTFDEASGGPYLRRPLWTRREVCFEIAIRKPSGRPPCMAYRGQARRRYGAAMYRSFAFLTALMFAAPASAQLICGDRAKIVADLGKVYQESRSGIGLASNGSLVELYTAKTGTWTMLITAPSGPTCVVGSGEGWDDQPRPAPISGQRS